MDEITLRENVDAFGKSLCAGVEDRNLNTTALDLPLSLPVMIAPTAFHKLATDEGGLDRKPLAATVM